MTAGSTFRRKIKPFVFAGISVALLVWGTVEYRQRPNHGLPYRDSFVNGHADEWKAFGGTWELANGSMRNDSDERGAKLLTGSSQWTNYSVEADVMLLGLGGDAGLMLRSSDEEQGVDAYTGYYAGLRTLDNSLIIGRAGHAWVEVYDKLNLEPQGVRASRWYHLKLLAYGCQLAVRATLFPEQGRGMTIAITDRDCVRTGRAGLRSYAAGGVWRDVVIRPAVQSDLTEMLVAAGRELLLDRVRPDDGHSPWDLYASFPVTTLQPLLPGANPQMINTLRLPPSSGALTATVRGTVVLASPALFVQDATGGVSVQQAEPQALKVGDEVQVTGRIYAKAFSPTLGQATVRVLWENTPMLPVSVTASQAATGKFDATFIEVEGRLTGKERGPDDNLVFDFDEGPQSFQAIMNRGRGDTLYSTLKPGSRLRLRGIAVSDATYTHNLVPFALLLRSSDDAVVLAGPPWWNARHAFAAALALILLVMVANFFYHRAESWRLRAVLDERERMAYEMHDTLSQSFAGIGFQLKAIRESMPDNFPQLQQQLALASDLVRHSHDETRRSIAVLRPEQPGPEGLLKSLRECAERLVEGGSVQITATCLGEAVSLPLRVADAMYHIGQEALANAVRHGHPSKLEIRIMFEKTLVEVQVIDNGGGFLRRDDLPGFGICSMRKRAANIGAAFDIVSSPGEGTQVSISSSLKMPRAPIARQAFLSRDIWRQIRHVASIGRPDPNSDRG